MESYDYIINNSRTFVHNQISIIIVNIKISVFLRKNVFRFFKHLLRFFQILADISSKKEGNILNSFMLSSGDRLKECRTALHLTQNDLAEKISNQSGCTAVGGSEKQISFIENGKRPLSEKYASLLGKALDVRPEYLLALDNFKNELERATAKKNAYRGIEDLLDYIAADQMTIITCSSEERCDVYLRGERVGTLSNDRYESMVSEIFDFASYILSKTLKKLEVE